MLGAPSCPQSTARFGPVPCAEPLGRRAGDKLCGDKLWHSHISLSAGDMDVGAGRGLEEHSLPCSALCLWGFPLGSCFKAPDWGDTEGAAPKMRPFGWRPPRPCHGHSSPHPTLPGWGVQPQTLLQAHRNSPVEGEPASSSLLQPRDTDRICGVQLLGFVVPLPRCLAMLSPRGGEQSLGRKRIEPQLCLSRAQPSGSKVPTSPAALGPIWRHHLGLQPTEQDLGCRKNRGQEKSPSHGVTVCHQHRVVPRGSGERCLQAVFVGPGSAPSLHGGAAERCHVFGYGTCAWVRVWVLSRTHTLPWLHREWALAGFWGGESSARHRHPQSSRRGRRHPTTSPARGISLPAPCLSRQTAGLFGSTSAPRTCTMS